MKPKKQLESIQFSVHFDLTLVVAVIIGWLACFLTESHLGMGLILLVTASSITWLLRGDSVGFGAERVDEDHTHDPLK